VSRQDTASRAQIGTERPGAPSAPVPNHAVLSARRTFTRNTKFVIGTDEPWLLFHPVARGEGKGPDEGSPFPFPNHLRHKARSPRLLRLLQWAGRSFSEAGWARNPGQGGGEESPGPS